MIYSYYERFRAGDTRMAQIETDLFLADRIWLAVAMLHREFPAHEDFSKGEIRKKLRDSGLDVGLKRTSIHAHLKEHMIANVPPSSTRYRMLYETRPGYLRLFRPDDPVHPLRQSGKLTKHMPKREDVTQEFHSLLDWYDDWVAKQPPPGAVDFDDDPLLRLRGSGKHIWADEHADEYVENLRREDW
jgi:hypothetical protein